MTTALKLNMEDIVQLVQDHFVEERARLIENENFSEDFVDKVIKNCIEFTVTFYVSTGDFVFPLIYGENAGQANIIYMSREKYFQFEVTSEEKPRIYSANTTAAMNSEGKFVAGGARKSLIAFEHYINRPDLSLNDRKLWRH